MAKRKKPKTSGTHWAAARRLTALLFATLFTLGAFTWFPWFTGTTAGTTTFGIIPLTDPLAAIEVMLASRTWHTEMVIGAAFLIGFAILVGPVFCGWVCPLGLLFDLNQWLSRVLKRRITGKRTKYSPVQTGFVWVKYTVLGIFIGFSAIGGIPVFQILSPINILSRSLIYLVGLVSINAAHLLDMTVPTTALSFSLSWGVVGIATLLLLEHKWPRFWCRMLCPLGALYCILGRIGLLKVRIHPELAGKVPCKRCTSVCPMGIQVMESFTMVGKIAVTDPQCTRCGACIDVCPKSVLRLGWRPHPNDRILSKSLLSTVGCTPECRDTDSKPHKHKDSDGNTSVSLHVMTGNTDSDR